MLQGKIARGLLTCAMTGGLLLALGTSLMQAANNANNEDQECQNRVSKAQLDVDKAAPQHGQGSHQVATELKKLDAAREWCAKHHADWDHSKDKEYDNYRNIQQH
jgi:hypothetical protein